MSSGFFIRGSFCMGWMVVTLVVGATAALMYPSNVREEGCPKPGYYAYVFRSLCGTPAQFGVEYHLVTPRSNALKAKGGLTKYPRDDVVKFTDDLSDEGSAFTFAAVSSASEGKNITLGTNFTITHVGSQKKLGWVFNTTHLSSVLSFVEDSNATQFQLAAACNVPLICWDTVGARCESYFLLTANLAGTEAVDNGTYIVQTASPSSFNIPLLLRSSPAEISASVA